VVANRWLIADLRGEIGYEIMQQGCHHDDLEFGGSERAELARRIVRGGGFCSNRA